VVRRLCHDSEAAAVMDQSYITFTGGISASSTSIDAAKDLMALLRSPVAIGVMQSQGMEPGK
jgi:hypothetical protein